eukprot:CAMPEP_0194134068 /NCGR_PEP_ID=MMETSP0152-20130528/4146_1 /TAXON_ID=1049557 /ORGANISM="Thalassiothrix antarctica, Strain L6-D1" /LENGTH=262 /DNA_ID=CAMNT_0038829607 /DNA_START=161 /DNA_END=949 /DNA_ORIENTATION=-
MTTRPKILLLGDSLTQIGWDGWVGELAHVYQRRADVINRGMSGYNTQWYLDYASSSDVWNQGKNDVRLITIFFGANDASHPELNPHHHIPVQEFESNLERLLMLCEEHYGKEVGILFLTAPPVVHKQRLAYQKQRYGDKATGNLERNLTLSESYADATLRVATKHNKPSIHLWKEMQDEKEWESLFTDGLHFSKEGNQFVAKSITKQIAASYPDLSVTPCPITNQYANSGSSCPNLESSGPYHDQINHLDHRKAFVKEEGKK